MPLNKEIKPNQPNIKSQLEFFTRSKTDITVIMHHF